MNHRRLTLLPADTILLAVALSMVACGGEDEPTAKSSSIEPQLQAIEQKVFAQSCTFSSCHGTDSPKQGLSLVAPTHAALVGKPSNQVTGRVLVVPFDADQSYLYEKLIKEQPASGSRMPFASDPLSDDQITAIKLWIENGAPE